MRHNRSGDADGSDDESEISSRIGVDLSMRQLLMGFFEECEGPANTGKILAKIFKDEENQVTIRVRVADIATRLLGQHVKEEGEEGLASAEEIAEEERKLGL